MSLPYVPLAVALLLVGLVVAAAVHSVPMALLFLITLAVVYLAVPSPSPMCPSAAAAADGTECTPTEPTPPTQTAETAAAVAPPAQTEKPASEPPTSGDTTEPIGHQAKTVPLATPCSTAGSQWIPSQQDKTFREEQRDEFAMQRAMRRDTEWHAKWTEEDKIKFENQRRNVEYKVAKALRADPYMIVQRSAKMSDTLESDYPFASVHSQNNVWHTSRYRTKMDGVSDKMIANLKSKI